jgi:hypothetical protein
MKKLIMKLMGRAQVKEVEYRYVFTPRACGGADAVCVG